MIQEYEHEDYALFHVTKELKRIGVRVDQWDNDIGPALAEEIRRTKDYKTLEDTIRRVLAEVRRRNRSRLERELPLLHALERQLSDGQKPFEININLIAPSGVPFLYHTYPRMKILINPAKLNFNPRAIKSEVQRNRKIIEYLFGLGLSDEQAIHDIFHMDIYFRFFAYTRHLDVRRWYTPQAVQIMSAAMKLAAA